MPPAAKLHPALRRSGNLLLLALAYFASAQLGFAFSTPQNHITLFWLPSGIAVAALLRLGWSCWPGILVGSLLTEFSLGHGLLLAAGSATGMLLGPLLAVWLLRRWRFKPSFTSQRDLLLLIAAAASGSLVSASAGVGLLSLDGHLAAADAPFAWLHWWLGDALGVLLAAPLLLSLSHENRHEFMRRPAESLLCLLALAAVGWLVFFADYGHHPLPLAFLPMPLLIWAALRKGVTGTSLAVLLLSALTATGTAMGKGVFGSMPANEAMYLAWLYMFTVVLTGLMVTAILGERKGMETALQRTNELLALAQREASAGVWDWDMESGTLTWSDELFRLFGLDPRASEASFEAWRGVLHPDDRQAAEDKINASLEQNIPLYNEYRIVLPSGEPRWIVSIGNTVRDEHGRAIRMAGLCFDITANKDTRERLLQSEELLRKTQSVARIGSWRIDLDDDELVWTDETYRIFGVPPGTPMDFERFVGLIHPDDQQTVRDAWQKALRGVPYFVQHRIVVNGETRWVEERAQFDCDAQGKRIYGTGSAQDITERRQIEDTLRMERDQRQRYLDTTMALMVELNRTGEIVMINRAASELLGYAPGELQGRNWFETCLPQPDGNEVVLSFFRRIISGEINLPDSFENPVRCRDGSLRDIAWKNTTIVAPGGKIAGVLSSGLDITERKKNEAQQTNMLRQLEEKELAKTRFLAAAGHDLRQPVAAASLFLDTLKLTSPTPPQRKLIEQLDQSMKIFSNQLARLLNISKFDAGLIKPDIHAFDLAEVFDSVEQNFARPAQEKQLRFVSRLPKHRRLIVHADIGLLESALMNLVSNAVKFTSHGGILVCARPRRDSVLLQVWDTGIGIGETDIPRIFEEFFQVDNPQRNRNAGLGLGLSIGQRAVNLMGSRITCRSCPGRGSVFEFSLPLHRGKEEPKALQSGTESPRPADDNLFRGKYVVVLEDDELVAGAQVCLLQGLDARVRHFHNAEEALRHGDELDADYFIADYSLGSGLTGYEFLKTLQQKRQTPIRAVILTGETSSAFVSRLSDCPWPILHKPANLGQILSALAPR